MYRRAIISFFFVFQAESPFTPNGSENISPFILVYGKKLSGKGKNLSLLSVLLIWGNQSTMQVVSSRRRNSIQPDWL